MNRPYGYEITVEGNLPTYWAEWFAGMTITNEVEGSATMRGPIADQAALLGMLMHLHGLNITLISVSRYHTENDKSERGGLNGDPSCSHLTGA